MTVLELLEMMRGTAQRANEHCSARLDVDVQLTTHGILIVAALHKPDSVKGKPEVDLVCTGEIDWEELPDCDVDMLRKFVDDIVSDITDDRKTKKGAQRKLGEEKGKVIRLFGRDKNKREKKQEED